MIIVMLDPTKSNRSIICKDKVKFTLEQATKAQRGGRCSAVLFLQPRR